MERRSRCKLSKLGLNASTPNSTLLQSCLEEAQKQATNLPQNCTLAGLKGIELCFAKLWPATMFCLNLLCLLFALALAWPSFGSSFMGPHKNRRSKRGLRLQIAMALFCAAVFSFNLAPSRKNNNRRKRKTREPNATDNKINGIRQPCKRPNPHAPAIFFVKGTGQGP